MGIGPDDVRDAALVISECQNGLINPRDATTHAGLAAHAESRGIAARIAALAAAFRAAGRPVAHATIVPAADWSGYELSSPLARHMRRGDELKEGTRQAEIHPALTPVAGDILAPRRTGMTSFHGTGLEEDLRAAGVTTVVVVGISTNIAVPGTSLEAVNRGLRVVVAEDCTAATTQEIHDFQFTHVLPALARITSSNDLIDALDRMRAAVRSGAVPGSD